MRLRKHILLFLLFLPGLLPAGNLVVRDSLTSYAKGSSALHRIRFTLSATGNGTEAGIPADGKVRLVFPSASGFDLTQVVGVMSADQTLFNGGFTLPEIGRASCRERM